MIHRVLDLGAISVREIMVPRNDIVSIDVGRHARRGAAHHDRAAALAAAGVRGHAGEDRRHSALQGPAAGLGGAAARHPHRAVPAAPSASRRLLRPHTGGARNQAALADAGGVPPGPLAHGHGGGRVRHHRRHADRGGRAGADCGPDRRRARRKDGAPRLRKPTKWNWTAPPGFATWRASTASRSPPMPASKRWPGFCCSAWARFRTRANRWSTSGRRFTVLEMERNRIARVRIEKAAGAGDAGAVRLRRVGNLLRFVDARHRREAPRATSGLRQLVVLLLCLVYLVRADAVHFHPGAAVRLPAFAAGESARPGLPTAAPARRRWRWPTSSSSAWWCFSEFRSARAWWSRPRLWKRCFPA